MHQANTGLVCSSQMWQERNEEQGVAGELGFVCVWGGVLRGGINLPEPWYLEEKIPAFKMSFFFLVCEVEGMAGPLENQAAVSLKSLEWLLERSKSKLQSAGATGKRRGCLDQI